MTDDEILQPTEILNFTNSIPMQAYDATLEAWATAVEYHDKEAKGHTRRVTELTLWLAKVMELSDHELKNVQRGAVLHDIGNMVVPENILHSQRKLTVEEWVTIHMHPYNAYEMLEPIVLLRPALEIPYFHHEKWDGTGYPRGMKGEQIPLAARIFTAVDVYDAMISDRPFRKAWPKEEAVQYILDESGKHFDPKVVKVFMDHWQKYAL
ncbi:MAG: phosphohydrolase [Chloroflexi bacterium RBG_13_50_21]|jgi:HD-GYP domain-containing protein (c-di-GMP phosphodiesterase class II)|nr:MAG: phosphohydrolase [Chloroflexi bacterium RBG_13_50_21]OGO59692.1 MAG: phosphohydrolase [Chloroflexi bacterium RBG_19FT_COMBO_47_9]